MVPAVPLLTAMMLHTPLVLPVLLLHLVMVTPTVNGLVPFAKTVLERMKDYDSLVPWVLLLVENADTGERVLAVPVANPVIRCPYGKKMQCNAIKLFVFFVVIATKAS